MPATDNTSDNPLLTRLQELVQETDFEFVIELIDIYLSETPTQIQAMVKALDTQNHHMLTIAAHTLKGSSLNLGAKSSNCLSWNCTRGVDGIAVCSCPTGQVAAATSFLTEAGQGNPDACAQYPVSLPLQMPEKSKGKSK